MIRSRHSKAVRSGQSGFTLVELVVALGVTAVVMLGIMMLFDFNNKLTRVQSNVTDMQQSLRIAQYDMVRMVRMAGRGGLDVTQGVVITRDVEEGDRLTSAADSPQLMPGSDVLIMRGVFNTPIFQISYTNPGSLVLTPPLVAPKDATGGYVEICKLSPSGKEQDLDSLESLITKSEALILVSPLDDRFYIVVKLDTTNTPTEPIDGLASCPGPGASGLKVAFTIDWSRAYGSYGSLSAPQLQAQLALEKVGYVGFLEEYRFYVRDDRGGRAGYVNTERTPVLSRARFFPGTDEPYGPPADHTENLKQDIADGIIDLQIAMGFDANNDGVVTESLTTPNTDEWFGNAAGEAAVAGDFKGLRISTLVRTRRPDNTYEAPVLPGLEDHVYDAASPGNKDGQFNGEIARKYRRRVLQTIVNLRNLTS